MTFMWLLSNFKSADAGKQFWDSYKGESHISFREFLKDMFFIVDFFFAMLLNLMGNEVRSSSGNIMSTEFLY